MNDLFNKLVKGSDPNVTSGTNGPLIEPYDGDICKKDQLSET